MDFFVFILVLSIIAVLLNWIITKATGVKRQSLSDTAGKRVDSWRRGIILVILLFTLIPLLTNEASDLKMFWMIYLVILLGSEAFLEWKYLQNSKQYLSTLVFLVLGIILIYKMESVIQLFGLN